MPDNSLNALNKMFYTADINNDNSFPNDIDNLLPVPAFQNQNILLLSTDDNAEVKNQNDFSITSVLSDHVYKRKDKEIVDGWEPIAKKTGKISGFKAVAYKKGNDIIVVFRGTANIGSIADDVRMGLKHIPKQYKAASKLCKEIADKYPTADITVTGHSLGGSLAQLVASSDKNIKAITYNAYGVKSMLDSKQAKKLHLQENNNTINYVIEKDWVAGLSQHVGEVVVLNKQQGMTTHDSENFVKISQQMQKAQPEEKDKNHYYIVFIPQLSQDIMQQFMEMKLDEILKSA